MDATLTVAGTTYGPADLGALRGRTPALDDLADFLEEWFAPDPFVQVQTSGSTGTPKTMRAEKRRMEASARMTCGFLGLKAGDTALLCMPLKYIGAKMMVVRALVWGLDLHCVPAAGRPLRTAGLSPDFLAMTPAQVHASLEEADEARLLERTRHLIIGGSAVDAALGERLRAFPHSVWSTYGMTETLSHIALRRLNGPRASAYYTPLDGVSLRLTEKGTLAVCAPAVCAEEIVTNDLAELHEDGTFRILGRADNVINSGGVKIRIEDVEAQLLPLLPQPFQITAASDSRYGEVVVLLVEETTDATPDTGAPVSEMPIGPFETAFAVLHPYARPKRAFRVKRLPRTGSGKPDRAAARELVKPLSEARHA